MSALEKRDHPPECLKQEEWGEIREFVKNTGIYRSGLCSKLEDIRKENKERFEILLAQIRADKVDRDDDLVVIHGRISKIKDTAGKIIFWGVGSLITFAIAWGALTTTVVRNTGIIAELQGYHRQAGLHGETKV